MRGPYTENTITNSNRITVVIVITKEPRKTSAPLSLKKTQKKQFARYLIKRHAKFVLNLMVFMNN